MSEKYELMYIFPAKHTEDELETLSKKIAETVKEHGGEVEETHYLGRRKLSYPIKQVRNGHYYLIIFQAEKEAIAKLNSTLRLTTELLRHLIVIRDPYLQGIPKLKEEYVIVQKRMERDRGGPMRRPRPGIQPGQQRQAVPSVADQQKPKTAPQPEGEQPKAEEKPEEKITIEELDKKLDKILTDDIL